MKKVLAYIIIIYSIIFLSFNNSYTDVFNHEEENFNGESKSTWSTTNPFISFENGTSTQVIKERAKTTDYWYSTDSFEITLVGTGQKRTFPRDTIMGDSTKTGPTISTIFRTDWEKDIFPKFNLNNISGPLIFKINAVIKMHAKDKEYLYYDSNRVKKPDGSSASEWQSQYNGIERKIKENLNILNELKNLTIEDKGFVDRFLADLRSRGLPKIIWDYNFGDPMTDLAICLRYNNEVTFNPASIDYITRIIKTGVESEPGGKANPADGKTYTALISYSAESFKSADTLMPPVEVAIENGYIVEAVGGTKINEYTVRGDMTLTPQALQEWNNSSSTEAATVAGVNIKSYEVAGSTKYFDISNPLVPTRYIIVTWKPNGNSKVAIKSRINKDYNNNIIKPENPFKTSNNEEKKDVSLLGTDFSTVVLRTGTENTEKPDVTKVYDGIAEYSISVAGAEKIATNPQINIKIQNGVITQWNGIVQPEDTKEISGKADLSWNTLEGWNIDPLRKAYTIAQAGKYTSWMYSAINNGRSDLLLLENHIKPPLNINTIVRDGEEQYFHVMKNSIENTYRIFIPFKWRPAADNAEVIITTQIIKDTATPESDTTNNQFAADINYKLPKITDETWEPGIITFDPGTTNGWTNKDVDVNVAIQAGKEAATLSGTDDRDYWERVLDCPISSHTHSDTCQPDCPITAHTHSDSCRHVYIRRSPGASCRYTQVWNAATIEVAGDKYPFDSKSISNKSKITLNKDGIGSLKAHITLWNPSTKSWNSSDSPPSGSSTSWYNPSDANSSSDTPKDTQNPIAVSNDYRYDSTSGIYKIDKTKPYSVEYNWDNQSIKGIRKDPDGVICHEYTCSPDNSLTVTMGDNLSGIQEARYFWTENKGIPSSDMMIPVHGFQTSEGKDEKKSFTIDIHDHKNDYESLKKGLWYLHVYLVDRAGNETNTCSEPVYINKVYNLKINTIFDFGWKKYFRKSDNTPTKLSVDGIGVEDMPVYKNKEGLGIKMGYSVDLSLDTVGLEKTDSRVRVKALFYGLDKTNTLTPVDVYAWNKDEKLVNISDTKSDYYTKSKLLELSRSSMITPDKTKPDYNTWKFSYFIPYNARIVKKGANAPVLNYEKKFTKLLVVFDVNGFKNYGGNIKTLEFSKLENGWSQGNGSIYGENYPVDSDLLTEEPPYNDELKYHGQIFWYDLSYTVMDDINKGRKW